MSTSQPVFSSNDLLVLSHAVAIVPALELAAYATTVASKTLEFPLKTHSDLKPLFSAKIADKFAKTGITLGLAAKFLPKQHFPIVDAQDFLGKAFGALVRGEQFHAEEKCSKDEASFASKLLAAFPKHEYITPQTF